MYRRKRGRGLLLGSDWPKINRNLQLYLRKRKQKGYQKPKRLQKGGTWWGYKKLLGIK